MKYLKNFILLLSIISFTSIYAQHDHSSHSHAPTIVKQQAPHGGEIKEIGKYKLEVVSNMMLKKDQLRFYLFKGNFKPLLNQEITGELIINKPDGTSINQSLQAKGDDFFVAQVDGVGVLSCTIKFLIKGKRVSKTFIQKGLNNKNPMNGKQDGHENHQH